MAKSETLPIFLDTYKFMLELCRVTGKFPREYKFSLGQDMKNDAMHLLRDIFQANHQKNKSAFLDDFLATHEMLQLQIRLSCDMRIMPIKTMAHLSLMMDSIGRQANAWNRSEKLKDKSCFASAPLKQARIDDSKESSSEQIL